MRGRDGEECWSHENFSAVFESTAASFLPSFFPSAYFKASLSAKSNIKRNFAFRLCFEKETEGNSAMVLLCQHPPGDLVT